MAAHQIHIHGTLLAALLQSAAVGQRHCDGLLFGQLRVKEHREFQDDESVGVLSVEERHLYVTNFLCCARTCSFYDGAGQIDGAALQRLLPPAEAGTDPLIGWFSFRPHSPLQPSMREAAVTQSLAQLQASQPLSQLSQPQQAGVEQQAGAHGGSPAHHQHQPHYSQQQQPQLQPQAPTLFAAISTQPDHNGATLTMHYRVFQCCTAPSSGPPSHARDSSASPSSLLPAELHVMNLDRGLGHRAYESFEPVMSLPRIMTNQLAQTVSTSIGAQADSSSPQPLRGATAATACGGGSSSVLDKAADVVVQQVSHVEEYYDSLVRQLALLCRRASDNCKVDALLAEQQALLQALQQQAQQLQGSQQLHQPHAQLQPQLLQ